MGCQRVESTVLLQSVVSPTANRIDLDGRCEGMAGGRSVSCRQLLAAYYSSRW